MSQIEVEQCEQYIKQLKEQTEQEQLRIDNQVTTTCPHVRNQVSFQPFAVPYSTKPCDLCSTSLTAVLCCNGANALCIHNLIL